MENKDYLCPNCGSLSAYTSSKKELLHCKKCNKLFPLKKELIRKGAWNPHITDEERKNALTREDSFIVFNAFERMKEILRRQKDES